MEGEGTVVAAGVADHPHQQQLALFGMLIRHPVEELCRHTHTHTHVNIYINIYTAITQRPQNYSKCAGSE